MVSGQWTLGKTLPTKNNQTNFVLLTTRDKLGRYILGCFQTVGLKVPSQHTARNIKGHHNIDHLGADILPFVARLRSSQGNHQKGNGHNPKKNQGMSQVIFVCFGCLAHTLQSGDLYAGMCLFIAPDVPRQNGNNQEQCIKVFRICKI